MVEIQIVNDPQNVAFSSEMVEIQIVNDPQNVAFSLEMVEFEIVIDPQNVAFSSEMVEIQIVNDPQNVAFSSEMVAFEEGFLALSRRVHTYAFGWPCRVGPCRRFTFSTSSSTTSPRFARAMIKL